MTALPLSFKSPQYFGTVGIFHAHLCLVQEEVRVVACFLAPLVGSLYQSDIGT